MGKKLHFIYRYRNKFGLNEGGIEACRARITDTDEQEREIEARFEKLNKSLIAKNRKFTHLTFDLSNDEGVDELRRFLLLNPEPSVLEQVFLDPLLYEMRRAYLHSA